MDRLITEEDMAMHDIDDKELNALRMQYSWLNRAYEKPFLHTANDESLLTTVEKVPDIGWIIVPTVRETVTDQLEKMDVDEAVSYALEKGDYMPVSSLEQGVVLSHRMSQWLGKNKQINQSMNEYNQWIKQKEQ
tara:strand:- start:4109 stop:4510 length:402 start_codon:yes stop_codon:yes gene_type:complete